MIQPWRDTHDPQKLADQAQATGWFVSPSRPMFVLIPVLMREGMGFWPSLALGCVLTFTLYLLSLWIARIAGVRLWQSRAANAPFAPCALPTHGYNPRSFAQ
jgi:hypothetical protein